MSGTVQPGGFLGVGGHAGRPRILLPLPAATAPAKPARAKLWELNASVHCSVIGTCLTTAELRRAMGKAMQVDVSGFTDHDLHSQAVSLCGHHNAAGKVLSKTLEGRHETVVKRFAALHGEAAVMQAWADARRAGDIPGAYWAVLTHPDVGHEGLRRAFGDVHMLSHLVGAANRADIRRLQALEEENATLQAKVERQQHRLHDAVIARDVAMQRLGALLASPAAGAAQEEPVPADPAAAGWATCDAVATLRGLVEDLQARLGRDASRRERLERRVAETADSARHWERQANAAEARCLAAHRELAALEAVAGQDPGFAGEPQRAGVLPAQRILYVGGHPGCVEQMRALLEAAGGALLVHDGGRHNHPSLLGGLVSQADQVAFPVDCVSHDAALAVKRLCRQAGKPWVALRSPGLGSFLAALSKPLQVCAGMES